MRFLLLLSILILVVSSIFAQDAESVAPVSVHHAQEFRTELDGDLSSRVNHRKILGGTASPISSVEMNEHVKKCLQEECTFEKVGGVIPKIVHFVWFQSPVVPEIYEETLRMWKETHPDWTFLLWTQKECEQLIREKYGWFVDFYNEYEWMIQKIDAVRYFIIYHFGGLVSDIDLAAQRSLTNHIADFVRAGNDVILLPSVNMGGLSNGFAVAAAKNDFHKRVVENLKNPLVPPIIKYTWYLNPAKRHTWIMISAGPRYITNERRRYLELPETERKSSIGYFDPKKFLPCTACSPKPCSCPDCYLTMLQGGLWHEKDSKFLDGMRCFFEPLITTRIYVTLLLLLTIFGVLVYVYHHERERVVSLITFLRKGKGIDTVLKPTGKSKPHDLKV